MVKSISTSRQRSLHRFVRSVANKPKRVVVDLSKVTYLDSSGLAVLIDGMQNTQEYGGEFSLAAMQEDIRAIFEIACLDQVFKFLPDVECALAADAIAVRGNGSRTATKFALSQN